MKKEKKKDDEQEKGLFKKNLGQKKKNKVCIFDFNCRMRIH
jgi:hypothetical protein